MSVRKDLLLILKSSGFGDGEPDLGMKLMSSFLDMLLESNDIPSKIICLNAGIFLSTSGSSAENQMNKFIEAGSEILSCGTCLDYYDRKDKLIVGKVTNMRDTIRAMIEYKKILSP